MLAIYKREIQQFLTTPIGYLVIGLFLGLTGLFLWVFKGEFNIWEYGFADLSPFFLLAPWTFLFLIPALTMRSFSEERKMGTLELLFIKPISTLQLVVGKFLGNLSLALLALAPTFVYVLCVSQMGTTVGNLDMGPVLGSYLGLFLLMGCFTSIGLLASALTDSQIVAFLLGTFLCFVLYYGFEALASLLMDGEMALALQNLGMRAHFDSIARGVLGSRDVLYFLSVTVLFGYLTVVQLQKSNR